MAPQAPEEEWEPLPLLPLPAQMSGGNSSRLKLDMPSPFDGDKKKTKSFLRKLNLYFAADPVLFANPHNKVLVTLSLCSIGSAETWAEIVHGAFDKTSWPSTWNKFLLIFKDRFEDQTSSEDAFITINTLKQGTRTAEAYFDRFETLLIVTEVDPYKAANFPFVKQWIE